MFKGPAMWQSEETSPFLSKAISLLSRRPTKSKIGVFFFFFFYFGLINWDILLLNYIAQSCPTLWTVACQAPLSMGFSRQENWSGCHFLLRGIFLAQESTQVSCTAGGFFYCLSHRGSPLPDNTYELSKTQYKPLKRNDVCRWFYALICMCVYICMCIYTHMYT